MYPSVTTPTAPVATCRAMLLAALAVAVLLLLAASDASARSRHTVEHNADGSTTARTGVVRAAPGGGGVLRGHSVTTDGQGHGSVRSGAAVVGPNGATAVRQGQSARNADGSVSHSSAMAAQGRTTTATSATTGNSVQTSSSYNADIGRTRSASCFDASGAPMACPARP